MTKKFQNKYRIESSRLQNWDYGWNGAYFVTICTQDKICYFGEINNCTTQFSEIGEIANKYWQDIPFHFPYVFLDAFVVMPNHVHGIIKIDKKINDNDCRDAINRVSADNPKKGGICGNINPMLNENLSRIIRWYKGRVTFESRKIHADFRWQSRFHDHIIRNDESFKNITNYIKNNPTNWKEDKFNKEA